MTTKANALITVCHAFVDAIDAAGPAGVPSGHLYAAVMDRMSLETYESIIEALVGAGKITRLGHLLIRFR